MTKTTTKPKASRAPDAPAIGSDIQPLKAEHRTIAIAAIAEGKGRNVRSSIDPAELDDLKRSIAAQGLLQSIIVSDKGDDGFHMLLAGRRRLAAVAALGWTEVGAVVVQGGAERQAEITLIENLQRVAGDPLLEADAIARMLERPGWKLADVAAALGKSLPWVTRRAALHNLGPKTRAALQRDNLTSEGKWTLRWLEELALLSETEQLEEIERDPWEFDELKFSVRAKLRQLSQAAWPLDLANVGEIHPCTACSKHSAAQPSLFPEEPALHKLANARCLDSACWTRKRDAWARQAVVRAVDDLPEKPKGAKDKGPELVIVHGVRPESPEVVDDKLVSSAAGKRAEILDAGEYVPAKKSTPGAVHALVVDGPNAGERQWVKKGKAPAGSSGTGSEKKRNTSAPKSMAQKRRDLERQRALWMFREWRAQLAAQEKANRGGSGELWSKVAPLDAVRLTLAFGLSVRRPKDLGRKVRADKLQEPAAVGQLVAAIAAESLQHGAFGRFLERGAAAEAALADIALWDNLVGDGKWSQAAAKRALEAIPEPKGWSEDAPAAKAVAKLERTLATRAHPSNAKASSKAAAKPAARKGGWGASAGKAAR